MNPPIYSSAKLVIPSYVLEEPERTIPNRWLLRKLADAVFNFLGYQPATAISWA